MKYSIFLLVMLLGFQWVFPASSIPGEGPGKKRRGPESRERAQPVQPENRFETKDFMKEGNPENNLRKNVSLPEDSISILQGDTTVFVVQYEKDPLRGVTLAGACLSWGGFAMFGTGFMLGFAALILAGMLITILALAVMVYARAKRKERLGKAENLSLFAFLSALLTAALGFITHVR